MVEIFESNSENFQREVQRTIQNLINLFAGHYGSHYYRKSEFL